MNKLHFLICSNLAVELQYVLAQQKFPDADIVILESDCSKPIVDSDTLSKVIDGLETKDYSDICIIGSVCLREDFFEAYKGVRLQVLENCFELFLNKSILLKYISEGYYIISSGWLNNCWSTIEKWGFDSDTIKQFFSESTSKILYLDTNVLQDQEANVKAVADHLGLGYDILDVGLDYFENVIHNTILQWRYDKEKQYQTNNLARLTQQAADYATVFDQINYLTALKSEAEIVKSIMYLFNMLFSCRNIVFLPILDGIAGEPICYPPDSTPAYSEDIVTWMKSGTTERDIMLSLSFRNEEIGLFRLQEVAFPKYISHYKHLSEFLSSICALGISNARKYTHVQSQERLLADLINQKDKLFSVLAHDLKRPVANFIGLTDLMQSMLQSSVDNEYKKLSGMLYSEARSLYDLLQNLLEWAMYQSGRSSFSPLQISFGKLAEEALNTTSTNRLEKLQRMVKDYDPDITIVADPKMLGSILRNLLYNAIKFTPVNGKITLSAHNITPGQVEISVSDTGIGMPEDILDNLFKVGKNVSRAGTDGESSTGLGLILCNDFVLAHGSQIRVESRVGLGTRISFTLPATEHRHQ